jgi:hypothetical protein
VVLVLAPSRAIGETPREVRVVVAGDGVAALEAIVRERLGNAGASANVRRERSVDPYALMVPPPAEVGVLAHVWIDFSQKGRVVMLLLDASVERGLLRYVSRAAGDEVAREEIGHVLQTAVEALMAGERIGLTREQLGLPPPPAPPPVSVHPDPPKPVVRILPAPDPQSAPELHRAGPEPRERWWIRSGIDYEVGTFAEVAPVVHGPGVALETLRGRDGAPWMWGLRLSGQWRLPVDAHAQTFVVRLQGWAVRAQATFTYALGRDWAVLSALGGGFDLTRVLPRATTRADSTLAPPDTALFPTMRGAVGFAHTGPVRLSLWLACDVGLGGVHYEYLSRDHVRARLFDPYPVRPGLTFEVGTP